MQAVMETAFDILYLYRNTQIMIRKAGNRILFGIMAVTLVETPSFSPEPMHYVPINLGQRQHWESENLSHPLR
ncbi:MAG: hypothetical protein ACLTJG_18810 [[Clostridium] innocuum]